MARASSPRKVADEIDKVVDSTPVFDIGSLDEHMLHRLIDDCAEAIYPYSTIATRYGFASEEALLVFLKAQPPVLKAIKETRAIWNSEEGSAAKARKLALHGVIDGLASTSAMITDPRLPDSVKLEALKTHSRIAGLEGPGNGPRDGKSDGQQAFVLNMNFSGGRTETIRIVPSAPTIENDDGV